MKARLFIIVCLVLTSSMVLAAEKKQEPKKQLELKTEKDKLSYAVGQDMGKFLKMNSQDIDSNISLKAINDAISGRKSLLKAGEATEIVRKFQDKLMVMEQERMQAEQEKHKKEGENFLAKNKTKEGVKTLASGLQYKVIKEGTGKIAKETDTVLVQYRGTLIDGTEFDSSYKDGKPVPFPVNGVIKGWTEALLLMKEGSKWQIVVPSNLAYGETGQEGGTIGSDTVLIFEIELVSIKAE
jgi:FKBP-type peptidyl-prolyl cis-trans isomerase